MKVTKGIPYDLFLERLRQALTKKGYILEFRASLLNGSNNMDIIFVFTNDNTGHKSMTHIGRVHGDISKVKEPITIENFMEITKGKDNVSFFHTDFPSFKSIQSIMTHLKFDYNEYVYRKNKGWS